MKFNGIRYTIVSVFISMLLILIFSCFKKSEPQSRDPLKWPFSRHSIWNMPIGDSARYIHARLEPANGEGLTLDEDLICLTPKAPMMGIYENSAGWDSKKNRCDAEGKLLYSVPFPDNLVYGPHNWVASPGFMPNAGLVSLMPDGRTIKQSQPFARCYAGKPGTSMVLFKDQDIYGEGIYGAHGGSGLSALGGCIRVGELMPGSGPIRHAIKMNIWAAENIPYDSIHKGFTWPAPLADGYAAEIYGTGKRSTPFVKEVLMGALLALPSRMSIDSLAFETDPGKRLAQAFQDYGAYIVDDTYRDCWAIETEWGADGRWSDQFKKSYGFDFETKGVKNAWSRDLDKIFFNLHVVVNNKPGSPGGGGNPRKPLSPQFRIVK